MNLILDNKKQHEVTETSTIESVTILADTYTEIDLLLKEFTIDNLKNVVLNDITYERIIPVSVQTEKVEDKIAVTFINRKETNDERFNREIKDLQETIATLVEGGIE